MSEQSPYQPPRSEIGQRENTHEPEPAKPTGIRDPSLPASILLVVCILGIARDCAVIFAAIFIDGIALYQGQQPNVTAVPFAVYLGWQLLLLLTHLLVLSSMCDVIARKRYHMALNVCRFSFLPFFAPLILVGIPLAIWTHWSLRQDGVQAMFAKEE